MYIRYFLRYGGYTFDFIAARSAGILDICDMYLLGGCAVLIITAAYFQICENKKIRGLSREGKKFSGEWTDDLLSFYIQERK